MWTKKLLVLFFLTLCFGLHSVRADGITENFIIEDIRLEGLQRFSSGVVTSRLPVTIGSEITVLDSISIIKNLYKTGYFRTVEVLRDGNVLVIRLQESPTIFNVELKGFEEIQAKTLQGLLESIGVKKAAVFNQSTIEEAINVIKDIYIEKNFYQVKIEAITSPVERNRINILFNIEEGEESAIQSLSIKGNEEFSDFRLSRELELEPKGILNFFTDNYKYSDRNLEADLGRLRTFYLEKGYLGFAVVSKLVEFSPDKKDIDILIHISEGKPYTISQIEFDTIRDIPREELSLLSEQAVGDIYSGASAQETISDLTDYFKNLGYANTNVNLQSNVDKENNMVSISYVIETDQVIYVREINIVGNEFTADKTIRREMVQFEKELYSAEDVESSRKRINRLGYFQSVRILQVPVNDSEIDLLVEIVEKNTGEIGLGAGFSTDGGISYNLNFDIKNIFGTGNNFSSNIRVQDDLKQFGLVLEEHYYTNDGVSRHIGINFEDREADDDVSDYSTSKQKIEYGFSFPFTDDGKYNVYAAYEKVKINDPQFLNTFYRQYLQKYGDTSEHYFLIGGLDYDTRDAATAPKDGNRFNFSTVLSIPGTGTGYYKYGFTHDFYHQFKRLSFDPVLHLKLGLNYGDVYDGDEDIFPFYERYTVGGINTVRGYEPDSIGFAYDTSGDAIGGKLRIFGTAETSYAIDYFKNQQIYLVPFMDAGVVGQDVDLARVHLTYGIETRWLSPVGPLRFSYAWVATEHPNDSIQNFQFSISTF